MEPDRIHLVLALAEEIEKSERALFEVDNILAEFSRIIQGALPFEFVAIQLFNKEDRTLQTVYATGRQEGLVGLAKHPIDGDDAVLDIQASVFNADPPKITVISGWDSHFDKLLYDQFNHASLVRVWTPIIVLKDVNGTIISDWSHVGAWRKPIFQNYPPESISGQTVPRYSIDIFLDKEKLEQQYGHVFIEKIGTVEAGHTRLMDDITYETAVRLADIVTQLATSWPSHSSPGLPLLREASLDCVLETTARSAMRVLDGKAATLHFCYDEVRDRYIYEVASGAIGPEFLATHPPRKTGLGRKALKENHPLLVPDFAGGQPTNYLETANPAAWELGIRTMAAFPLIVGTHYGVLYIGFAHSRCLTEYDHDVINRFLGRAIQAIRTSTYHRNAMDENRRLVNLNSIAGSLLSQDTDESLLHKIGGNALNLLAADVVTIHEYAANKRTFLNTAISGHCLAPNLRTIIDRHLSAQRFIEQNYRGIVIENFDDGDTVRALPDDVRLFLLSESFVRRLGIVLEYGAEVCGVMFVYYRRHCPLSPNDRKAVEILAAHAAIAMRIRRAYRSTQATLNRREKELAALSAIDQQIVANPADLKQIHGLVLDSALDILGADSGAILMLDGWSKTLCVEVSQSYPTDDSYLQVHFEKGVVGQSIRERQPCLVEDISAQPWRSIYNKTAPLTGSEMAIPLLDDTGLRGVLNVKSKRPFTMSANDKIILNMLSVQATIAIHIAELVQKLRNKITSMRSLSFIVSTVLGVNRDLDSLLMVFLTGITSREGLGLGRAVLFLVNHPDQVLSAKMAVGPICKGDAERVWRDLVSKERELAGDGTNVLGWYVEQAHKLTSQLRDGSTPPPPLWAAISNTTVPIASVCALTRCVREQHTEVVSYEREDALRGLMEEATGQSYHDHAFACVPLIGRAQVLGALLVDNRFLPTERDSTFDIDGLQAYAGALAIAIENNRLQNDLALSAVMTEIVEVGHRLKRPISDAKSLADLLADRLYDAPYISEIFWNSEVGALFKRLHSSIRGALKMTEELSEYKDSLPYDIGFRQCNLNEALQQWIAKFSSFIECKIDLRMCDDPIHIRMNDQLISRAIRELLINADTALRESAVGAALISVNLNVVGSLTHGNAQAEITISDNGPGIKEHLRTKIFQPLFTTRRERGGTGVGLWLVRQFVEQHHGRVSLGSQGGAGAKFVVSLPI